MTLRLTEIRVTVSGSFHRHLQPIQEAVELFTAHGAIVLSPADPRVVDRFGEFLFVASDLRRSIRGVQSRHLDAIGSSALVWLECPDGYVGSSAAMEVGYAIAAGVPVVSSSPPADLTLRQFVQIVSGPTEALTQSRRQRIPRQHPGRLSLRLDPIEVIAAAHAQLEQLQIDLISPTWTEDDPTENGVRRISELLSMGTACR